MVGIKGMQMPSKCADCRFSDKHRNAKMDWSVDECKLLDFGSCKDWDDYLTQRKVVRMHRAQRPPNCPLVWVKDNSNGDK